MKINKKFVYAYFVFATIMYISGWVGTVIGSILGGTTSAFGFVGGLLLYAVMLYPGYYLLKRYEDEW